MLPPRQLSAITVLSLLCASPQAFASYASFEAECEARLGPTKVKVVTEPSSVLYDFSLSTSTLTQRGSTLKHGAKVTLGRTEAPLRVTVNWGGNYLTRSDGRSCMRPEVTISLTVSPQTVYVGSEFPKGSCAFNAIAEHELRHVYANQNHLEATAEYLQGELSRFFGNNVYYGERQAMRARLEQGIQDYWLPLARKQLAGVDQLHAAIDSPQEYAKNRTICGGEILRRIQY